MFREIKQTQFEYYYAEEGIYIFRKIGSNILHIVKGSNPFKALFGQQRGTTHWMTFVKFELTGNGG